MEAVPGLLLKGGAEGVDGFALADGRAGGVKIEDGAARGRVPVTVALLRALGAGTSPAPTRRGWPSSRARRCSAAAGSSARSGRPSVRLLSRRPPTSVDFRFRSIKRRRGHGPWNVALARLGGPRPPPGCRC